VGLVMGALGGSLEAKSLSTQERVGYSLHSLTVSEPLVYFPNAIQADLRMIKSDGEPLVGVAWVRVERHPFAARAVGPRRGPSSTIPIVLAAVEERTDPVTAVLPAWAHGPMQVVVGHRPRTKHDVTASVYVVNPAQAPPAPEVGKKCWFDPVLEGPGYNYSSQRDKPSLEPWETVVSSAEEWSALLASTGIRVPESWGIEQPPDAPIEARYARPLAVDFEKEMVLALFKGQTGPDELHARLAIKRLRLGHDGVLRCDYTVKRRGVYTFPVPDDFSPFLMVAVPKMDAPVDFRRVR